jgi:hypothetical protein
MGMRQRGELVFDADEQARRLRRDRARFRQQLNHPVERRSDSRAGRPRFHRHSSQEERTMATQAHTSAGTQRADRGGTLRRLTTETKVSYKTTEFIAYLVVLVGILIAGNSIEGKDGGADYFAGDKVWLYATILTVGYMVSRGLAKSGSREPYFEGGSNEQRDRDR